MKASRVLPFLILLFLGLDLEGWAQRGTPPPDQSSNDPVMVARAETFLRSLTPAELDSAVLPFSSPRRLAWSNNSYNIVSRPGLSTGELTDTQRVLLQALIQSALSPSGYLKVINTLRLDDYLHVHGAALRDPYWAYYGQAFYWIAFFGSPSVRGTWGWKFEGHHLSLNFGFREGKWYATPLFLGAHPDLIRSGPEAGFRFMEDEKDKALALAASLDPTQRKKAVISDELPGSDDIRARTGTEPFFSHPEGLSFRELGPGQKQLFEDLLNDYVGNLSNSFARALRRRWPSMDPFHFAWMGPMGNPDKLYYALEAPGFSIEFIVKEPLHIHTLMRAPTSDSGGK